ncbi:MAG: hypothetical protein COV44_00130 [Deltaproteobacteria bacterium CG11_big_fil_rev_8_21_14_0_20_45_16]|nr:MAG: hypothetical protein COV44_00130 [Deltaproteobacteria bacterium CG11_big_fil_rev_8_21_14_0_20_45_16]
MTFPGALIASFLILQTELEAEWILTIDVQAPPQSEFSFYCINEFDMKIFSRDSKTPAHIEEKLRSTPVSCKLENKSNHSMQVFLSFPEEDGKLRQIEKQLEPRVSNDFEINSKVKATKIVREEKIKINEKGSVLPDIHRPEFQGQGLQKEPNSLIYNTQDDFSVRDK